MAHQQGTATGPIDLLDQLRLFCIAQSIQVNEYLNDGTRQILSIQFGSGFYSIAYDPTVSANTSHTTAESFIITQSTSWTSSTAWGSQPNQTPISTGSARSNFVTGTIPIYHFFYFPGGMLYVSFQLSAGNWSHFGVGDMVKFGDYTGGSVCLGNFISPVAGIIDSPFNGSHAQFGMTSNAVTHRNNFRVDYLGSNKFYFASTPQATDTRGYTSAFPLSWAYNATNFQITATHIWTTPSVTTQATTLYPIYLYINQGVNTAKSIPVGELPDIRIVNMRFFNSGDVFDTDWYIFSIGSKRDWAIRDNQINTGYIGVALRFQ